MIALCVFLDITGKCSEREVNRNSPEMKCILIVIRPQSKGRQLSSRQLLNPITATGSKKPSCS